MKASENEMKININTDDLQEIIQRLRRNINQAIDLKMGDQMMDLELYKTVRHYIISETKKGRLTSKTLARLLKELRKIK